MSILGAWIGLLALANGSPQRGRLLLSNDLPLTISEMALKIGTDMQTLKTIIDAFEALNMIYWDGDVLIVTNWDDRQFKSDHSADRVRQHRERQKEANGDDGGDDNSNDDETLQNCYGNVTETPPEQNQNRTESEQNRAEHGADAHPPFPSKKRKPSKRKTPSPAQQASREMFAALAELCQIDWRGCTDVQRKQLNQSGKLLREKLNAVPADLKAFSDWWYAYDWRGRGSKDRPPSPPKPSQVRETWGQFTAWRENGGKPYGANRASRRAGSRIIPKPPAAPVDPARVERDRAALRAHRAAQGQGGDGDG